MGRPVLIYTSPTCPDCQALKLWRGARKIRYEGHDLSGFPVADEVKVRTDVRVAPTAFVGDAIFFGPFPSQGPRIEATLGLYRAA